MPRISDMGFDKALMACRAVRPEEYRPDLWEHWKAMVAQANGVIPPDYAGRIFKHCEECGIEVQVGPRQQQGMEDLGEDKCQIMCLVCAGLAVAREHETNPDTQFTLASYNNPYQQKS